jgi:hypothetical protein
MTSPSPSPAELSAKLSQDDSASDARPSSASLLRTAAASVSNDAATLTANLVQRGRNPWWGKDQAAPPAVTPAVTPAAVPAPANAVPSQAGASLLCTPLPRPETSHIMRRRPAPFHGFNRAIWRDVIVFLAVFAAGLAAMLLLPLRAL